MKAGIICTIIFIIYVQYGCVNSDKEIRKEINPSSKTDTTVLMKRIIETKKELDVYHLSKVNDSVKFYLYNIFYDEQIMSKDQEVFFCFYDLIPIYADSTQNSVIIRYNLLKKDNDNNFNEITNTLVDVEYKTNFTNTPFNKNKMSVVGKIYLPERLKSADMATISGFLNQHDSKVNKWYKEEISKRITSK